MGWTRASAAVFLMLAGCGRDPITNDGPVRRFGRQLIPVEAWGDGPTNIEVDGYKLAGGTTEVSFRMLHQMTAGDRVGLELKFATADGPIGGVSAQIPLGQPGEINRFSVPVPGDVTPAQIVRIHSTMLTRTQPPTNKATEPVTEPAPKPAAKQVIGSKSRITFGKPIVKHGSYVTEVLVDITNTASKPMLGMLSAIFRKGGQLVELCDGSFTALDPGKTRAVRFMCDKIKKTAYDKLEFDAANVIQVTPEIQKMLE